ncbi:Tn3 family transposase [Streptomyces sp. CLV115]|uniref:Tn3 family transposase n=1 Tax=Streptomyces sp. CLV115 TaxID=3138502 RepID=UPI00406C5FBF
MGNRPDGRAPAQGGAPPGWGDVRPGRGPQGCGGVDPEDKNATYSAFREVGRIIRTVQLLRYLTDAPLRRPCVL